MEKKPGRVFPMKEITDDSMGDIMKKNGMFAKGMFSDYSEAERLHIHDRFVSATLVRFLPLWLKPNHLTILRFMLVPVAITFLWLEKFATGTAVFVFAALTDVLDGTMARTRGQITTWGKIFDPLADKMLICGTIAMILLKHMNPFLAFGIIFLETSIVLGSFFMSKKKDLEIKANNWGKAKMVSEAGGISIMLLSMISGAGFLMSLSVVVFGLALSFGMVALVTHSA